jgi:hypothetical protein
VSTDVEYDCPRGGEFENLLINFWLILVVSREKEVLQRGTL